MKNNYILLMFAFLGLSNSALAQIPNANFTTTIDSNSCGFITVFFHDSSTGSPVLWHWDFGDGASDVVQNPVHNYLYSAGTVAVSLIVIDSAGIADTMSGYNITTQGLIGTFSFSPITGCAPLTVTFTASSSTATYFTWDFGDGIILSDSSSIIQYTYFSPILASPQLLLNEILPNGSLCQHPAPPAGLIEIADNMGTFDFTLQQDTSQNSTWNIIPNYSNQITTAVWNWGDGSFSTGLFPSHTYAVSGWYNICATVFASCGDSATSCQSDSLRHTSNNTVQVNVINPLVASIDITSSNTATKLIVYPNPFTEQTTISFNKEIKNATIKIMDVVAKEVKKINFSGTQLILDKGELDTGIYFIQLTENNNNIINKKIVIQ